ncbi:Bifunctional P-450/NADPH-P450 reductase 6 [Verticillium dahliae]
MLAAGRTLAPALLFVGCRSPDHDALYREEFDEWQRLGAVDVRRNSRTLEQSNGCKYVQDRMWTDLRTSWTCGGWTSRSDDSGDRKTEHRRGLFIDPGRLIGGLQGGSIISLLVCFPHSKFPKLTRSHILRHPNRGSPPRSTYLLGAALAGHVLPPPRRPRTRAV